MRGTKKSQDRQRGCSQNPRSDWGGGHGVDNKENTTPGEQAAGRAQRKASASGSLSNRRLWDRRQPCRGVSL